MENLKRNLKVFKKTLDGRILNFHKIVSVNVLIELLDKTPIDTSKAVSNWQVTLNETFSEVRSAFFLGRKGSTGGLSKMEAFIVGNTKIAMIKKVGSNITIYNKVDYIDDLNKGTSSQAGANFIENAVNSAISKSSKVKL